MTRVGGRSSQRFRIICSKLCIVVQAQSRSAAEFDSRYNRRKGMGSPTAPFPVCGVEDVVKYYCCTAVRVCALHTSSPIADPSKK